MSYARNLLSRGEEIVFETRQHWFAVFAAGLAVHRPRGAGPGDPHLAVHHQGLERAGNAPDRLDRGPARGARTHRPGGLGLAEPGVPGHDPPDHQGGGRAQQDDGRLEPREDQRRSPYPELGRPHLRLRPPRHHDRVGRAGRHRGLPDDGRGRPVQDRDDEPEGAPGAPGARPAAAPAANRGACDAARRGAAAPRRVGSGAGGPARRLARGRRGPESTHREQAPTGSPATTPASGSESSASPSASAELAATLERLADLRDRG